MKSISKVTVCTGITCYFIGNAHDFSEHVINLATISFNSVTFERLESVEQLLSLDVDRPDRIRSIIFNQSMTQPMIASIVEVQSRFPEATTVLAYRQPETARNILAQMHAIQPKGGIAFLPMNRDVDRWLAVLRLLVCGENYIPSELHVSAMVAEANIATAPDITEKPDEPARADKARQKRESQQAAVNIRLTSREAEVLSCVAEGKQNKLIANRLGLSEHTVKLHIHHVIAKLGVNNRTEAAVWFLENHKSDKMIQ